MHTVTTQVETGQIVSNTVHICTVWWSLPDQLCAWAEMHNVTASGWAWLRWPTKGHCFDVRGSCKTIWSILKPVFFFFADFERLVKFTSCLDVNIWFSWWQQQQTDRQTDWLLYPCACVRGNKLTIAQLTILYPVCRSIPFGEVGGILDVSTSFPTNVVRIFGGKWYPSLWILGSP